MRTLRWIFVAAVGCGGCAGPDEHLGQADAQVADADVSDGGGTDGEVTPWPALEIDVEVEDSGRIVVTAREVDRPFACTYYPFTRSGCEEVSDVLLCPGGPPGAWITEAHLLSGDQILATVSTVDLWFGLRFAPSVTAGHDDLTLVLQASDQQRATIPIPTGVAAPQPTVDDIGWSGGLLHVTWSSSPTAASSSIELYGDIGGYRCHVVAPQQTIERGWSYSRSGSDSFGIRAYADAPPIVTPLGEARVWIGGTTSGAIPPPT